MDFENRYYSNNYMFNNNRGVEEYRSEDNFDRKSCCLKRVETFYCCPSYYTEEKKDCKEDKKEEKYYPCYEGTFRLCPYFEHNKEENKKYDCDNRNDHKENNNSCRCRNKCCFCSNLFGKSRLW